MTTRGSARRRRTQPPQPASRRWLPIVVAAFVIGAAAVIAIVATQTGGSSSPGPSPVTSSAATRIDGSPLPPFDSTSGDPAVGHPIPIVEGTNFEGQPVAIRPDGKPKVLIFIAHWCPHCQREVPLIQAWIDQKGPPKGVELVSIATANDPSRPNYPPDAWLKREHWSVPVIADPDNRIAEAYGLTAFPYFVFVDAQGKVVARATGELPISDLEAAIAQLTGSSPSGSPAASGS